MRDLDVRLATRSLLHRQHEGSTDTLMVEELGLCGRVRVDLAVINGEFAGYELKSERDTLERLPAQVLTYSQVLDRAYLVVAERHLKHARKIVRPWWGLFVARSDQSGRVDVDLVRESKRNTKIDKSSLVQLLWKDEALQILDQHDLAAGVRSKPREFAWSRLAASFELDDLRDHVRRALKARREWRVSPARAGCDATSRRTGTSSRFLDRRIR